VKSRWFSLLTAVVVAVLLTAYGWLTSPVDSFISWPARLIVPAVWPSNWLVAKDPSLFYWARMLIWVSNITLWTLMLFTSSRLALWLSDRWRHSHA
jgi:hypothetical protein